MDEATFGRREDPHHHGFKHRESSPFGWTVRGNLKLHFFCLHLSGVCNWKGREMIQSTIQPLNLISFNMFVGTTQRLSGVHFFYPMGSLPYRGGRLHRRRGLHFCLLLCCETTETLKVTRVSNVQCMRANPVYRLIKICESLEGLFLSRNYATPSQTKKVFILLHGYRRTVLHAALLQRLL